MDDLDARVMDELNPSIEYRLYTSSQGGRAVAVGIKGEVWLGRILDVMLDRYPGDTIYVREVLETVVMVIGPDGSVTRLP
jgi:hypothetical protein